MRLMMIMFCALMIVVGTHVYGQDEQDTGSSDKVQTYYNCLSQFHMINGKNTVDCLSNSPIAEHEICFEKHIEAINNLFNGCKVFLD